MHASPAACTHAPDATDLGPQSHIVYHDRMAGAGTDARCSRDAEAVDTPTLITRHGGLIIELGWRPSDPEQSIRIMVILTVAQAVGMLFEQAQEEVGWASTRTALLTSPPQPPAGRQGGMRGTRGSVTTTRRHVV
jgi:hypothetical protein